MSSEVRAKKERYIIENYPKIISDNMRLNEDNMILTNRNRELKADNAELQDTVDEYKRVGK